MAIPFVLAPHQARVRNAITAGVKRFFVLVCGRRSGKTLGAVYITVEFLTTHANNIGWWVAPTFPLTRKGFRETIHFLRQGHKHLVARVNRTERRIEFVNGSFLEFRSAHEPDSQLVSEGLDWLVVDEAALIANPDVWPQYLRPALADRRGKALFITSPRGRNWLWELFRRGEDPTDAECVSWRYATAEAGFVDAGEIAEIRRTTPERIFQQEYLAQFLESGGEIFRRVDAAVRPLAVPDGYTTIGVDLARTHDWTVLWAVNSVGEVVEVQRFQDLDWSIQKVRLIEMYRRLKAKKVVLDTTGMHVGADAVVEDLTREQVLCEPVVLSSEIKRAVIELLMLLFDQGAASIPPDPVVIAEHKEFTYQTLPSGRDRYSAPQGKHDDTVIAHALARWGIRHIVGRPVPLPETERQREIRELIEQHEAGRGETDGWMT